MAEQNLKNHGRYILLYHFILLAAILALITGAELIYLIASINPIQYTALH